MKLYSKPEVISAWECAFDSFHKIKTPYIISPIVYATVLVNRILCSKEFVLMTYIERASQLAEIKVQNDYDNAFGYTYPDIPEYKSNIFCDAVAYQERKKRNELSEADDALLRLRCLYQMITDKCDDLYYDGENDKVIIIRKDKGVD